MSYILRTTQLTKVLNENEVVSNVSMNMKKGEIYGFLGPNGAGKTTIMRLLTNLIKPTYGEIEIFGQQVTPKSYDLLGRIGSIIEYPVFYDKLTARENLDLHCEYMGYHNKKAIDEVLELVSLKQINHKKVMEFSLGMKQRLGIARAIITKPELLILDEPINGLDPIGIKEIRELFKALCKEYGISILISSHILAEIEQIADTIGVINHGQLVQEVSMERIRENHTEFIELTVHDSKRAAVILSHQLHVTNFKILDDQHIRIYDPISQSDVTKTLIMNDVSIDSIYKKNSSLEDYFLSLLHGGELSA